VQGFASLAYEIVWTRVLAILMDGSTYAFSIILATVLCGIALGSALVSPLMSRRLPWVRLYAILQTGVAVLTCLGVVAFGRAYEIMGELRQIPALQGFVDNHYGWMAGLAIIAVLPPMLLLGASFPVAARIVVSTAGHTGRGLGVLYAGNTAGAIFGAWTAGFFLIPTFGTQISIELLAGINALLAFALCLFSGRFGSILALVGIGLSMFAFTAVHTLAPDMYQRIVTGRFPEHDVVWVGEGKETTVAVVQNRASGVVNMFLNGQGQASTDMGTVWFHRLIGHTPMILHRDPQDVLIVGIGGGSTAGALAQHNPRRLDLVELSDTVIDGAQFFNKVNGDILRYPNLNLMIDDGRNHLLLTDQKYDVVTTTFCSPIRSTTW
jgi:spermidine synthase